jgi:hypothetical protein
MCYSKHPVTVVGWGHVGCIASAYTIELDTQAGEEAIGVDSILFDNIAASPLWMTKRVECCLTLVDQARSRILNAHLTRQREVEG